LVAWYRSKGCSCGYGRRDHRCGLDGTRRRGLTARDRQQIVDREAELADRRETQLHVLVPIRAAGEDEITSPLVHPPPFEAVGLDGIAVRIHDQAPVLPNAAGYEM